MQCGWCNTTKSQIATAIRGIQLLEEILGNCTGDGSFDLSNWTKWPAPFHILDTGLATAVLETLANQTLLDVGAGSGQYGAWFEEARRQHVAAPEWRGVDGGADVEEFTRKYGPPGSLTTQANICDPALELKPSEWAMSLEVGEHLPSWCLVTYIRLLSRSARRGLFLSWAHPGQAGHCHVSSRSERWVRESFGVFGWTADETLTAKARAAARLWYLKRNTFVFRRDRPARRHELRDDLQLPPWPAS